MDYRNGAHLAKWQWDLIHDPAMLVSIFEGDDKAMMTQLASKIPIGDFILETNFQNPDALSPADEWVFIKGFDALFQQVAKNELRLIAFEDKSRAKTYFWEEKSRWYQARDASEYDNHWANDLLNAGIALVRPLAMAAGADPIQKDGKPYKPPIKPTMAV